LDVSGTLGATLTQSANSGTAVHINLTTREIYAYTSSLRFKHDITDLEIDSSKIFDLKPVSFTPNDSDRRDFGLIAEEVEPILPELVLYDAEGRPTAVRYEQLSVLLLNEMKKQKKEIEELKLALNEYGIFGTSTEATSSEPPASNLEHQTILDQFTLAIKKSLEKLGLILQDGIARMKELIAGKITTKQICLEGDDGETICIDKNQLKQLLEQKQIQGSSGSGGGSETPSAPTNQPPIVENITVTTTVSTPIEITLKGSDP
jgi:hypothetical protein